MSKVGMRTPVAVIRGTEQLTLELIPAQAAPQTARLSSGFEQQPVVLGGPRWLL
ncbi:MAG: hypothetical protein WCA22_18125 [Candidatus Binatus sp.]